MSTVFLLQNQHKHLLGKSGDWLDGRNVIGLYRSAHKDEALNQQFEAGSKDYSLRIHILECELNSKKQPIIADEDLPEAIVEPVVELTEEPTEEPSGDLNDTPMTDESNL